MELGVAFGVCLVDVDHSRMRLQVIGKRAVWTMTSARGGSLSSRSAAAVLRERFEREAGYGLEDGVVGDEWDPESDRGRGDPAVRVVLALCESVADRGAVGAQLGAYRHELGAGVDDLCALDLAIELSIRASPQPRWIAP